MNATNHRAKSFLWFAIPILTAVLGFFCMHGGHEWGDDFALYISQAKALSTGNIGELFAANKWAMDHSEVNLGPYLYPMGYPVLLIPIISVFGLSFLALKIWTWSLFILFTAGMLVVIRHFIKQGNITFWMGMAILCLTLLHPKIIESADRIASDLIFTGLVFLFFAVLLILKNGMLKNSILAIVLLAAIETRANGFFLIVPYLWYIFYENVANTNPQRKIRAAWLQVFITIVPISLAYLLFKRLLPNGDENHWNIFLNANIKGIRINALYYFELIGKYPLVHLATIGGKSLSLSISLITWIFVVIGMIFGSKKLSIFIPWIALNIVLLLLWPSQQGARFIFPIMPFIMFYFVIGIFTLVEKISINKQPIIAWTIFLVALVQSLATTIHARQNNSNSAFSAEAKEVYHFADKKILNSEVVSFYKPRAFYLATGIKAIRTDTDSFFLKSKANYWIKLKDRTWKSTTIAIIKNSEIIFENSKFVVLKKTIY